MRPSVLISALALALGALSANASPKDDVVNAAKKLGEAPNYSWKATVVVPEGAQFKPGPTEGQTEKDGYTYVKSTFGDNTMETLVKGDKGALTTQEGGWQSLADAEKEEGFIRFRAAMARNYKTPALQAAELAAGTKDLKPDGDAYSGELTEDAAKNALTMGRRGAGTSASNAKGSVKFWVKDGALTKYEYKVQGTVSFNGNDREVDRTTTVQINNVGSTKVTAPEQGKKNLG